MEKLTKELLVENHGEELVNAVWKYYKGNIEDVHYALENQNCQIFEDTLNEIGKELAIEFSGCFDLPDSIMDYFDGEAYLDNLEYSGSIVEVLECGKVLTII